MKFIVYVSQAVRPFDHDALASLLAHSRDRNAKDGITGLLIYHFNPDFNRGSFVQILEGGEAAIDDIWRRISQDQRHHTIIVIEEGNIERRMFGKWSMGFKNINTTELQNFDGFSDLGSDEFWDQICPDKLTSALELLKSFYDRD